MSALLSVCWAIGSVVSRRRATLRLTVSDFAAVQTAQSAGVHLLAAFSASLQGVIGQLAVAPDCNEITGALQLLKTLPLDGVIITGDAIFTQREICRVIIDGGGDYFFTVKDNQPTLKSDIALAFGPFSPLCGVDTAP